MSSSTVLSYVSEVNTSYIKRQWHMQIMEVITIFHSFIYGLEEIRKTIVKDMRSLTTV